MTGDEVPLSSSTVMSVETGELELTPSPKSDKELPVGANGSLVGNLDFYYHLVVISQYPHFYQNGIQKSQLNRRFKEDSESHSII